MSLRINQETRSGLKEEIREWILQSRIGQFGNDIPPSTVEFSLLEAISKGQISADRLEALNAIGWYRIVSNAPPGGLGHRETDDTLTLLRLLKDVQEKQAKEGLSGDQVFLLILEVLEELKVNFPAKRINTRRQLVPVDKRERTLRENPPVVYKVKRQ